MFKIKVYKQQLLVILIDIIPILLKGVILALTFFDEKTPHKCISDLMRCLF